MAEVTREQKVKTIVEAIKSGLAKMRINPESNGTHAARLYGFYKAAKKDAEERNLTGDELYYALYGGGTVGEDLLDRMYANALNPPPPKRKSKAKTPRPQKQVTEIIEAITEHVAQPITDEITERVAEKLTPAIKESEGRIAELQNELQETRQELAALQLEVSRLRESKVTEIIERAEPRTEKERQPENVLGFTLSLAQGYWYASKRRNGKNHTVYIGRDKSRAAAAIKKKFPHLVTDQDEGAEIKP